MKDKYHNYTKQSCYRIIPSQFPPIDLFEDVASAEEFEALFAIQSLTNPRLQESIGHLEKIDPLDRVYGVAGCGYIMAAFTHINPNGSRFSNGDYGVYYCSKDIQTAIAETRYHRQRFLQYTNEPAQDLDMRCLFAEFSGALYNLLLDALKDNPLYHSDNYDKGQALGMNLKSNQDDGLVYHSVRDPEGVNFALFKAQCLHYCKQSLHLCYQWDGNNIVGIYQKKTWENSSQYNDAVEVL